MENKLKNKSGAFIWNTLGTILNAFNSLFFLIIAIRINGVNESGVFTFAFSVSGILYMIAVYCGRTFQVTDTNTKISDNDYIASRLLTTSVMIAVALFLAYINDYNFYKFSIYILICIFRGIEALSDIFYGILQKNGKLETVGKLFSIKSVTAIVAFLLVDIISSSLILACIALICNHLFYLLLFDARYAIKIKEKSKVNSSRIYTIIKKGFFTFAFSLVSLYLVNIQRYAIDAYLPADAQTIYGVIAMPSTVMILVGQFFCQPVLVDLVTAYNNKDKKQFSKIITTIVILVFIICIAVLIGAYFLGIPVLNLVYGINIKDQLWNLLIIIAGATFYTFATIYSNALTTLRITFSQLLIYVIMSILGTIISYKLIKLLGLTGGAMSYTITTFFLFVSYLLVYFYNIKKIGITE